MPVRAYSSANGRTASSLRFESSSTSASGESPAAVSSASETIQSKAIPARSRICRRFTDEEARTRRGGLFPIAVDSMLPGMTSYTVCPN